MTTTKTRQFISTNAIHEYGERFWNRVFSNLGKLVEGQDRLVYVAVVLLVVSIGLVAQFSSTVTTGTIGSGAALTIITAAAVGIERLLEAFWTYIGLSRGSWWPLGAISEQFEGLASGLDTSFEPFYQEVQAKMKELQQANKWGQDKLAAAAKDLDEIKKHAGQLRQLPIDSQRVQLIAASASRSVDYFSKKYPEIEGAAQLANFGIQGVTEFVATFKDNPGRRLISIFAGMFAGLLIAGAFGLDMFQAVLGTASLAHWGGVFPHMGVAVTGLLMGLGANPTHEVIRLLQEIKSSRKAENVE